MSANTPFVVETTQTTFQADVIDRSSEIPVVVDFWAEWCGPCRVLGPILERLAREYESRFVLVKAETDRLPEVAAAFGVRSIPTVFGLKGGKVVDSFVGALPERAIRAWLDQLMLTPAEQRTAEAKALEPTDPAAAEAKYRVALALAPGDPTASVGLARLLVARGKAGEARGLIEGVLARGYREPEAERLKAELDLKAQARTTGGVEEARAAVVAHPKDRALRLKLAEALAAVGSYEEALDLCLDLVETDRKGVGEEARKTMLAIFQLLPDDSELAADYRRRLSAALY